MVYQFSDTEPAEYTAKAAAEPTVAPDTLLVMTYNIKFGGGRIDFWFDCHGDRVIMDSAEVVGNMDRMLALIDSIHPHILLIQEADWHSKRAAFINQVQYILDHTYFTAATYASQWNAFVPSNGLGRVNSGNAVLSVFAHGPATRYALPRMASQDVLTRFFYLRRCILEVPILLGNNDTLWVLNTHLEAYDKDGTRKQQLAQLKNLASAHHAAGHKVLIGGDLNTMPPGTTHWRNFDDEVCEVEDFQTSADSSELNWLFPLYSTFQECVPLNAYRANQSAYFTHTTSATGFWNRRLDYLFTNLKWVEGSGVVYQSRERGGYETMPLSDHAPTAARLVLR
jgi:endonuclease/exonuclease/phosphatase family metal-dependent hydrolase